MKRIPALLLVTFAMLVAPLSQAAQTWTEGRNYELVSPSQHTSVGAGKVEVMEVFSYGCIYCNNLQPVITTLRHHLPANAQMTFLPASFGTAEDWPMFQRAYFTAQALGISERTHQAIFDAVWKTGELAIADPTTKRLKNPEPSIEDAAKCYEHLTGVKPAAFLAAAQSFGVDLKMRSADAQVIAMHVPSTPCIVVNGKYRIVMDSVPNPSDLIDLVQYLVDKEARH